MLRAYSIEHQLDWDQGVPFVLFAVREAVQESLGFSPFEMIFGHCIRGPLKLIRERWMIDQPMPDDMHEYVAKMKGTLIATQELAKKHLQSNQERMKETYDKKSQRSRI